MAYALSKRNMMQVPVLSAPGPIGGPGVSVQRPVEGEGQTDIGHALAARLVREKEVRQDGATATHAQVDSRHIFSFTL